MRISIYIGVIAFALMAFQLERNDAADTKFDSIYQKINAISIYDIGTALEMLDQTQASNGEDAKLMSLKRDLIIKDYKKNYALDTLSQTGLFSKPPASCFAGKLSEKSKKVVLNRINYFRRLAGIYDSCSFDPALSEMAQKAAFMMDVNDRLNHYPASSWKCYSKEGAQAAGKSNLSLGYGFLDALEGQIDDDGSGNEAVGHRRWILNPENARFGFGSTLKAMCLYVVDTDLGNKYKTNFDKSKAVCWPAKDYFPIDLVPVRWSFSLADADFKNAQVTVKVNGVKQNCKKEKVFIGYALNSLVWSLTGAINAESTYEVTISNVKVLDSKMKPVNKTFTYKVIPISIR